MKTSIPALCRELLAQYPGEIESLGLAVRDHMYQLFPDMLEYPDLSANVIGLGYGSGYKDTVFSLILSKKSIKVGISKGASLPDPDQVLAGSGKVHKYIEFKTKSDLNKTGVNLLLKKAHEAYLERKSMGK